MDPEITKRLERMTPEEQTARFHELRGKLGIAEPIPLSVGEAVEASLEEHEEYGLLKAEAWIQLMNRRNMLMVFAVGSGAVAAGCEGMGRDERFIEDVGKSATEIRKAFDDLEGKVAEFDQRDWREVVGDVKTAMAQLGEKIKGFEEWVHTPAPSVD
jgi:hypothetical protein